MRDVAVLRKSAKRGDWSAWGANHEAEQNRTGTPTVIPHVRGGEELAGSPAHLSLASYKACQNAQGVLVYFWRRHRRSYFFLFFL